MINNSFSMNVKNERKCMWLLYLLIVLKNLYGENNGEGKLNFILFLSYTQKFSLLLLLNYFKPSVN